MTTQIDFSEIVALKDFKVLGYTTDYNQCECCGKEGLKGTVSILDLNSDVIVHYGSTCAANANRYDTLEAVKKAKRDIDSAIRHYQETLKSARCFAWKYLRSVYGKDANGDTVAKEAWEPIVEDYEKWYTSPENKGKAHPSFKR